MSARYQLRYYYNSDNGEELVEEEYIHNIISLIVKLIKNRGKCIYLRINFYGR